VELALYHQFAHIEDTHWWFKGRRAIVREILHRWFPPGRPRRILDVGCGTGAMLELLREFGSVEGVDCSGEALTYCRRRFGATVSLHQGRLPDGLPPNARYEAITAFDIIEHVPDPVPTLQAMRLSLVAGGLLICTVPAFPSLWGPHDNMSHHCRRYTRALLTEHLQRAGLHVRWMSYFNTLLFPPVAAVRFAQKFIYEDGYKRSDFTEVQPVLNAVFSMIFASERFLLSNVRLPFGVSLIAIAEAPPADSQTA